MKITLRFCIAALFSAFLVSSALAQAPADDMHPSGMNQGSTDKSLTDTQKEKARTGKSTGSDMNGGTYGDMLEKNKPGSYKSSKAASGDSMAKSKKGSAKMKTTKKTKKSKAKKPESTGMDNQ